MSKYLAATQLCIKPTKWFCNFLHFALFYVQTSAMILSLTNHHVCYAMLNSAGSASLVYIRHNRLHLGSEFQIWYFNNQKQFYSSSFLAPVLTLYFFLFRSQLQWRMIIIVDEKLQNLRRMEIKRDFRRSCCSYSRIQY